MKSRKAKEQTDRPEDAKLCVPKEDFRKELEKRIELGKALLEVTIPSKIVPSYSGIIYPNRTGKVQYEENALKEWNAQYMQWNDYNEEYLKSCFDCPNNVYLKEYQQQVVWGCSGDILKDEKDNMQRQISKLESFCNKCNLFKMADNIANNNVPNNIAIVNNRNIFIVHGHNAEMKQHVARIIGVLGLNPVILHEQPDGGMTIIEKLEHYGKEASFAVILLTADDVFQSKDDKDKIITVKRARQNVVFEMGYFMAKLGRSRVFVMRDEESEKVGDIEGVLYTPTDSTGWIMKMVKELQTAGFNVDANKALSCM